VHVQRGHLLHGHAQRVRAWPGRASKIKLLFDALFKGEKVFPLFYVPESFFLQNDGA
jgi:hypothetical protein